MRWILPLLATLIVLLFAAGWMLRPASPPVETDLQLAHLPSPTDMPALVAIQPWLEQAHYQSADALQARLGAYLAEARGAGALPEGSIVVFPEHVGTWLVAAGAPAASFDAATTTQAMTGLILQRPIDFLLSYLASDETDRAAAAVFRMRGHAMAEDYQRVFSGLARDYGVTIAAGSIVLPDPRVEHGVLMAGTGPLYNMAAVFGPDGTLAPDLVRKSHPIPSETGFTAAWPASELPVFETPLGRLAVLVCADSWHPDLYEQVDAHDADIVAVPAFLQPSSVWNAPWHGYTTGWPDDADRADENRLSEGEAWERYSSGRIRQSNAQYGATAYLRGSLWDLGSDGANLLVTGDRVIQDGNLAGASISVLPLGQARSNS